MNISVEVSPIQTGKIQPGTATERLVSLLDSQNSMPLESLLTENAKIFLASKNKTVCALALQSLSNIENDTWGSLLKPTNHQDIADAQEHVVSTLGRRRIT